MYVHERRPAASVVVQSIAAGGGDERLLAGARSGDQACFERLIEPHIGQGYRLAATMLNDAALAEDAVQEAIFRAWRAAPRLRPGSRIGPWFLTIVANRCRSLRRTRWWSVVRLPDLRSAAGHGADDIDLVGALRQLGAEERAAIFLRFYEGLNSREIGEALGISAAGARSRIRRGLRRLRVELAEGDL